MAEPLPHNWPVPRWDAKAPMPCTKAMLIRWLAAHHGVVFSENARMPELQRFAAIRYEPAVCPNTGGSDYPATWDLWGFIVAQEKRIRGGQRSLL